MLDNDFDNVIQIMHHNRSRNELIDNMSDRLTDMMNEKIAIALLNFNNFYTMLTPDNETKVIIDHYKTYVDEDIAINDTSCIYDIRDTKEAIVLLLKDYIFTSAINNPVLKHWLNGRGVSDTQILQWKLIDLNHLKDYSIKQRNATGATIHPALRNWIPEEKTNNWVPEGIMIPVFDLDNNVIGCHNRFLSTVPMMKFASSVPNFHLFTDLRRNYKVKKIYIVEGVFDALAIDSLCDRQIGWIAPSTGFWTEEQLINLIYMLQHFPDTEVITMFDNDRVGSKSNILLYKTLNSIGIKTKIAGFEVGKDPAEAICKFQKNLTDVKIREVKDVLDVYKLTPYEEYRPFEMYMDSRHASYSNDNYQWSE